MKGLDGTWYVGTAQVANPEKNVYKSAIFVADNVQGYKDATSANKEYWKTLGYAAGDMAIEGGLDLAKIPSQLNVFLSGNEERKKESVQASRENIEYLEGLQQTVNTQFKEWAPYSDETFDNMQVLIASAQIIRETPKAANSAYEFFSQNKNKHITVLPSNSNSGKYITESTSDNQFNLNNNSKALIKETSNVATNNKSNVPAVYNRDSILPEISEQNNGGLVNKALNKNISRIANNNGNNSSIVSLKENGGSAKGSSGSIVVSEGQKQLASGKKIAGNGEKSEKSIGDIIKCTSCL